MQLPKFQVDAVPGLSQLCVTGGKLNAQKALQSAMPPETYSLQFIGAPYSDYLEFDGDKTITVTAVASGTSSSGSSLTSNIVYYSNGVTNTTGVFHLIDLLYSGNNVLAKATFSNGKVVYASTFVDVSYIPPAPVPAINPVHELD